MAITTYAELKTAVANFLARSDLTDRIPEFISMAEARMGRELETRSQEKRATATLTGGDAFVSLPTDLRSVRMHLRLTAHIRQRLCIWKVCQICRIVTRQIRF